MELLVGHYNELLREPMTTEQERRYLAYLNGAEYTAVEDLPEADPQKTGWYGYVDDHLEKGDKKRNIRPVLRFLAFIHRKGGCEAFSEFISKMLEYTYKGIVAGDFFFAGSPLTKRHEIAYYLYELDDQIHRERIEKYISKLNALADANPDDFAAVAGGGATRDRFRAAVFLYYRDSAKYGPIIQSLLCQYTDYQSAEPLFNACALTGFAFAPLCEAFARVWRLAPSHAADRVCWNKDYYPAFKDQSLFRKDYPYDEHPPCEMDYLRKVARAVGLNDLELLRGVYWEFNRDSKLRYLADFLAQYPRELIMELLRGILGPYTAASTYLHLYHLLGLLEMDTAPVRDALSQHFEELLRITLPKHPLFGNADADDDDGDDEDEPENYDHVCRLTANYLFAGDDALMRELADEGPESELVDTLIDLLGSQLRDLSTLAGLYAEDELLRGRVKRYADFIAYARKLYDTAPFIQSAMDRYRWDGARILEYFFEREMPLESRLVFLDEHLLSDRERDPKGRQVLTEEISGSLVAPASEFLRAHSREAADYCARQENDYGLMIAYYHEHPEADPVPLVQALKIKDKALRARAVKYIANYPSARPMLEELQSAKRKDIREHADKALAAIEKLNAFPGSGARGARADNDFDIERYAGQNLPRTAAKLLAFTSPQQWPRVRYAGREELVDLDVLRCYICLYLQSKEMERLYTAEKIRARLNPIDMKELALTVFQDWKAADADSKTKGAMTLLGIHGGNEAVAILKDLVNEFVAGWRSAMAADAVKALGVSHSTIALVTVDNLSRMRGDKRVRRVAGETIAAAAQSMGLTLDQMADKIVPNLGMNIRGEAELSTGAYDTPGRAFKAVLQPDLKVKLFRADGRELKSFPKMDVDLDHYEGYDQAKADFNLLKKELRNIVKVQTTRLELALASGRTWTAEDYRELFVDNPIMQRFASSLVFGLYEGGALHTFRYAGDGSFADQNDETYALPARALICIMHPCDMESALLGEWRGHFADYGITQPFPQLDRPVFGNADILTDTYQELRGGEFSVYKVAALMKYDWQRDPGGDAGSYRCTFYDDKASGIGVCLTFQSALDIVSGAEEDTTIDELVFYRSEAVRPGYALSIDEHDILPVREVPQKVFSEVLYRIRQVMLPQKVR